MSRKLKLEIDLETADRIVVLSLKDMVKYLKSENAAIRKEYKSLKSKDEILPEHKKADFNDNEEFIEAATKVLKFYS
jgi:hypothetical protein